VTRRSGTAAVIRADSVTGERRDMRVARIVGLRLQRFFRRVRDAARNPDDPFSTKFRNVTFEGAEVLARFLPAKWCWDLLYGIEPCRAAVCENKPDAAVREFVDMLEDFDLLRHYEKTLHIGCGYGRLEKYLSRYADQCFGVDVSSRAIRLAKDYAGRDNCVFLRNDGESLKVLGDNRFDLVYSVIVFQHISKATFKKYLREITGYLKPRGLFLFQVPLSGNGREGNGALIGGRDHHSIRRYSVEELEEMLTASGYRVGRMRIYGTDVYCLCSLRER
jgi:SAM-dependent methyltransferase